MKNNTNNRYPSPDLTFKINPQYSEILQKKMKESVSWICTIFEILAYCALIRQQRWSAVFQQQLTCARKIMMLLLSQLNSEHFSISLTSRYHCPYKLKIETAVFHSIPEWDICVWIYSLIRCISDFLIRMSVILTKRY